MGDVWKKLVTVCGRKTEVWGTGQAAGAYVHIVVIPGNPGSAGAMAPECAPLSPLGKTRHHIHIYTIFTWYMHCLTGSNVCPC